MNPRPVVLLPLLLGVLLAFLVPFEPARPGIKREKAGAVPAVGGVWSNARFMQKEMQAANEVVQQATGAAFVEAPSARVSDAVAVADALRGDLHKVFEKLGAENDEQVASMCNDLAAQLVAYYDHNENVVHVVPVHAVRAAEAAGDDSLTSESVLRLLLVRMAVIAQDRQLYTEWKEALDAATTPDAVHAAGAVLEGHAQYVTERIAEHWEMPDAFVGLVTLLTTSPPEGAGSALASEASFAIKKGHAFMKAVAKKRGRGGLVALLKQPPADRAPILAPASFLVRKKPSKARPDTALKELTSLVGEGWTSETKEQSREQAQALLAPLEPSACATVMAAFESGHLIEATHSERPTKLSVWLLEFRSGALAEAYVQMLKGVSRGRGDIEDGAGRDSGLVGFARKRNVGAGEEEAVEWMQWTSEGRFAVGLLTDEASIDRERQDDALEAATETLRKQSKRRRRGN